MVRLASVLRPRVQSLTVFFFALPFLFFLFFTFHNFFFAVALPEKFTFGSKEKSEEEKLTRLTLLQFSSLLSLFISIFGRPVTRKGSSSALHNARDG